MPETIRILSFNNEMEAQLLSEILAQRKIPHMVRSYRDSAYDGLWQTQTCWGHLEAPEEFREEILRIFNEMSLPENQAEDN